jgi:acyl-CoA thioesterase-1
MKTIVFQFANGNALFVGLLVTGIACGLRLRYRSSAPRHILNVSAVAGGILVGCSATPFPYWVYGIWAASLVACIVTCELQQKAACRLRPYAVGGLLVVSTVMWMAELPYHRKPHLPFPKDKPLIVIGDSLSGTYENNVDPWPVTLGKTTGLTVQNRTAGGLRVKGALSAATSTRDQDASILLEIGGNDLLGDTTARQFETGLRELLTEVCRPGRVVAMFELPLPPLCNEFGHIQRECAKEYGVILIPKSYMAGVLGHPDATLDGLHFSRMGHDMMASLLKDMMEGESE